MSKNVITAKLVHENNHQRFYELSSPITRGRRLYREIDIVADMMRYKNSKIKEEYRKFVPEDGCHIICISDALTHTERLCFVGIKCDDEYFRYSVQIDGRLAKIRDGGDLSSVYSDEVYLRHLGLINRVSIRLIK